MMEHEINPFQVLYVTDDPDLDVFVSLFSDYPVQYAQILFVPGNVILKGTQGSGKSMLLNLFRPEVRLAYHKSKQRFPVPARFARFVGAGMNLTRSGALNIGQRPVSTDAHRDEAEFPFYFADFINYFIVRDILETVNVQSKHPSVFETCVDGTKLDDFAGEVAGDPCWFGALDTCSSFDELCGRIDCRITSYRQFHNNWDYALPEEIRTTKTDIGEPISVVAEYLKTTGVVPSEVPFFIRIDQIERLSRSDVIRPSLGKQYRRIINKAIGKRDHRVSYRIGTRRYAWEDDLYMFGTQDKLEHLRDYRINDTDYILRRREDRKSWIFPDFAQDVLRRRLCMARVVKTEAKADLLREVFGKSPTPEDVARQYVRATIRGDNPAERILKIDPEWPAIWRDFLLKLFEKDPLEATLAGAWVRQRGDVNAKARIEEPPPEAERPWAKAYWRKERIHQALMQIAARAAQRLKWSGKEHIIALSAGNISIFLSLCYEVWEVALRSQRTETTHTLSRPLCERWPLDNNTQAVGIHTASTQWHEKITEQPRGDERQRFVSVLGRLFKSWLLNDDAMSYPGHNGFSVANEDLEPYPTLRAFLEQSVDYGDLWGSPHTTKKKNRRQRIKWYLNPILSPYFQIPESHVKEPYYLEDITELVRWIHKADVLIADLPSIAPRDTESGRANKRTNTHEGSLFDFLDEG